MVINAAKSTGNDALPLFYEIANETFDKHGAQIVKKMNCIIAYDVESRGKTTRVVVDMKNKNGLVAIEENIKKMPLEERHMLVGRYAQGYDTRGGVKPDCRVMFTEKTLDNLQSGRTNGVTALTNGSVKTHGNPMLAGLFELSILKQYNNESDRPRISQLVKKIYT